METFAERLASFDVVHQASKKRTSSAKSVKTLRWPHQTPSPIQLAEAGFFYSPTSDSPDNAICFLCQSNLDGWESDDSPATEHLKLAPHCGWAINVCIEKSIQPGTGEDEAPNSARMSDARKMTFGSRWPHEAKRGWVCKTQKMVDAGWYYCPTNESDDLARCAYCNLTLDGWEPKDNPYDEHQRRSADCAFFSQPASRKKAGKSKKGRTSKVSRMSILTVDSDNVSVPGSELNVNDSVMVTGGAPTKATKGGKGSKKGTQGRKANTRTKGKSTKAGVDGSMQASSFVEPEDDDFEVKVVSEQEKSLRGKKRKSEQMEDDLEKSRVAVDNIPADRHMAKKRATRPRASNVQHPNDSTLVVEENDVHMTDSEAMPPPPPPPPVSKKGGNGRCGRKRGSSNLRKASTTSTASMASLRAPVLDDEDIDAALEADLDRPLTDDEAEAEADANAETLPRTLPKTRRLTRTRPASRSNVASVAPARRTTHLSSIPVDDAAESVQMSEPEPKSKVKAPNGEKPRKVSKKQPESSIQDLENSVPVLSEKLQEPAVETLPKSRAPRSRQVSRQAPARKTRASELSSAPTEGNIRLDNNSSAPNSSALGSRTAEDDSGHETDASLASRAPKKKASKKGTAKGQRSKAGQKAGMMSRNIEDIVQPIAEPEVSMDTVVLLPPDVAEEGTRMEAEATGHAAPQKGSKKKINKQTRATAAKTKPVVVPSSPPASQISEAWTDQPLGESTPLQSTRPDITTFTPVEAAQTTQHPGTTELSKPSPEPTPVQRTPTKTVSPQSSDAENRPPSSRPSALRPPLELHSPSKPKTVRVPLAASTPTGSPSKRNIATSMPWTVIDFEKFFSASPGADKENVAEILNGQLTSPERKLTVEEWIFHKAKKTEEKLRNECERLVGRFEGEGVRALKTLEGIVCTE